MIFDELSIQQRVILIGIIVKSGLDCVRYKYFSRKELIYDNFELDAVDLINLKFMDLELLEDLMNIDWNSKLMDQDFELIFINDKEINVEFGVFTLKNIVSKIFKLMNESYIMYYEKFGGFELIDMDNKIVLNILLKRD